MFFLLKKTLKRTCQNGKKDVLLDFVSKYCLQNNFAGRSYFQSVRIRGYFLKNEFNFYPKK